MPDVSMTRCVMCGREYVGTARPRWAFRRPDGALAGTAHTSCATSHGDRREYWCELSASGPLEEARAYIYVTHVSERNRDPQSDDRYAALLLLHGLGWPLSDEQARLVDHWSHGPLLLGDQRAARVVVLYRRLCKEYAEYGQKVGRP